MQTLWIGIKIVSHRLVGGVAAQSHKLAVVLFDTLSEHDPVPRIDVDCVSVGTELAGLVVEDEPFKCACDLAVVDAESLTDASLDKGVWCC